MKTVSKLKYTWDLETLLSGKNLEVLYQRWINKQKEIIKLYASFDLNFNNFKKWIFCDEEYEVLSNRLFNYISNNHSEDQKEAKWIAWLQKLNNDSSNFAVLLSDFSQRIIKNKIKIQEYLKQSSIAEYQREYDLIFKTEPHILQDGEQKVLTTMGIINDGFSTIFTTLKDTEIKIDDAISSKNQKIALKTVADVMKNLKNDDRQVRKSTWVNFNKAHHNYENTFTQTLYYNYLMLNTSSRLHKFKDYVDATAFADEIDSSLITNLYKNAEIFKTSCQQYNKVYATFLKKKLHLKSLEPWDKNLTIAKNDVKFSIEQTKDIILKAFQPLGNEYIDIVKKAFSERWISWLSKPGKQQGAYSIGGTKGLSKYYISMNFENSIRSVSTIAHELGHSLNSYYIGKKQKVYQGVSIFYAEIPSIVNEMLLFYYLLDKYSNNEEFTKLVLDELISNSFSTISRQIVFSNTEYVLNQHINNSQPFTKENIKKVYYEMLDKYCGIEKEMASKLKKEPYSYSLSTILRIPHFYAGNFYVYKYAIGQIVATLVADKLYHGDKQMLKKYFTFLSSGSSLSPMDTIKLLGIDLKDPKIYLQVKKVIDRWIKQLSNLK